MTADEGRAATGRSTATALARVAATAWSLGFVGLLGTDATTYDPGLRMAAAILYGVPVVIAAVAALALRPHAFDRPLLALVGVYAVVSLLSSDRTASLETLTLVVAYASLFVVLLRIGRGWFGDALVTGAAFAATAWLAFAAVWWIQGLITWVQLDGSAPPLVGRSGSLWLSTDALAALAILAAPYYLRIERRSARHVLLGVALTASAIVIPLSGGRIEWAALIAAVAACWLAGRPRARLRTPKATAIGAGVAAAGTIIVGAVLLSGQLGTLSGRTHVWNSAIAVIANHPVTGSGPGTFSWVRLAESPDLLNPVGVYHAHNILLQTLADGGILLVAAFVAFCGVYLVHLAGHGRLALPERVALGSLVGFSVILMLDELTQLPALTALAIGSAAYLARPQTPARAGMPGRAAGALIAAGWMLVVALGVPATLAAHQARVAASEGRDRVAAGDWRGAAQAFAAAAEAWPARAPYQMALGLVHAHLGDDEAARAHYRLAHQLSPGDPRPLGALGVLELTAAARIDALTRASRLSRGDAQYAYRLALELGAAGDVASGSVALGEAAMLDPQLLVARELIAHGFDPVVVIREALGAAKRDGEATGVDLAAVEAAADLAAGRSPEIDPTMAAVALARSGRVEEARALLETRLIEEPHDHAARVAARELSLLACDLEGARRHETLLNLVPGGFPLLYVPGPIARQSRDHLYRETGLGDYQPPSAVPLPVYVHEWPGGYLPEPSCREDA